MKTTKAKVMLAFVALLLLSVIFAVSVLAAPDLTGAYFYGETDKDPMTYNVGETMTFTVSLKSQSGTLISVPYFSYSFKGDDGISQSGKVSGASGQITVTHKITCPGFVRLTVYAVDEDGNEIKTPADAKVRFEGGACAEWRNIKTAMAEPDDFDAYWERCLKELDTVDPDIFELKVADETNSDYKVYDLYVNCVGSKNFLNTAAAGEAPNGATYMAGKLTIPTAKPEGGYKFYLNFQGAGVYSSPGVSKKPGYITLCVYAHSIELSREADYYTNLDRGLLSGYMRRALYNDNAEESYTKYMVLRDLQAVRFLKKYFGAEGGEGTYAGVDVSSWKGLWNGKDIELYGQSQGGFQCIAVAALDHDITFCNPWVPCWCDMYAKTYFPTRRTLGLVYEHYSQKYFDSVALGKRIVCRTQVDTGFGDDTCPTTGVIAAYNEMTCEKTLNIYQGMEHNCNTWHVWGSVEKPKFSSGKENFKLPYTASFEFDWEIASVSGDALTFSGNTVTAVNVGTSTVTFADPNRYPITVEVEAAASDYVISTTASSDVLSGIYDAIYTRTGKIVEALTNNTIPSVANIETGNVYYVISDLAGTLNMTASQMYSEFVSSGADYLVMIPGSITSKTTAAMFAMQAQPSVYPNAYVCAGLNEAGAFAAGRAAGNNIVTIIEKNRPVLDTGVKVYNVNTGEEIRTLSVVADGTRLEFAVVPNSAYNNVSVSAIGFTLDTANVFAINGDSDGGSIVVNGAEYTVYPNAVANGIENNYSWLIDSAGKLTILSGDDLALTGASFPYLAYASSITEIEISAGASSIGSGAFAGVSGLTKITLPYTLEEIAADAISGATGFTVYGYENNAATTAYATAIGAEFVSLGARGSAGSGLVWEYKDNTLYITGTGRNLISGASGWSIAGSSWKDYYSRIKKVVVGDSVTNIGTHAFFSMTALEAVEITPNVVSIGQCAFSGCKALKSIYIKGNDPVDGLFDLSYVTSFPDGYQFDIAPKLTKLILSENIQGSLGDKFVTGSALTELTVPATVSSLASRAIINNSKLKSLTVLGETVIPQDLVSHKDNSSTALTAVYGRFNTPAEAFANGNNITFYDLTGDKNDGIVIAGGECGSDVYWKIVENEAAGTYTLYFYGEGTTIDIGSGAPWSAYASSITNVVYRGAINSMGANNLSGLTALEGVEFDGCDITVICSNAFTGSGISGRLVLSETVVSVEANAFSGCTALTELATSAYEITFADGALADSGITTVYGRYKTGAEDYAKANSLTFKNVNDILPIASGLMIASWNNSPTIKTYWYYDKATRVLSLVSDMSGWNETGALKYATDGVGWADYKNEVVKVIVGDGLGKVSQTAFQNHTALKVIELSSGIGQIDDYAFEGCTSLDTIYIRGNVPIEGTADLSKISATVGTKPSVYKNCAFDTVILSNSATAIKDGTFSGTPVKTVIGNGENTATLAATFGTDTTVVKGYSEGNMVWTLVDGALTVYTASTPKYVDSFAAIAESVTSIIFGEGSDITALDAGVFDGFSNLKSVTFNCDAPDTAAASCFGTGNVIVYYAKGITTFPSPIWNGYTCLEEGSSLTLIAAGVCKEDGYTWSIDDLGTLTISGTGNGILEFTAPADWDAMKNVPWNPHASSIKKIVIEESTGITSISRYAFAQLPNLTTVVIPTTLTDLGAYNILSSNPNLSTIAVQGNEIVEGVMDLRNIVKFNDQLFEASLEKTTPEIYLPANPSSLAIVKWAKDCAKLTFVTHPTCASATYVRGLMDKQASDSPSTTIPANIAIRYYSEEQEPTLARSGEQTTNSGKFSWTYDDATETLTFTNTGSGWNEFLCNSSSTAFMA